MGNNRVKYIIWGVTISRILLAPFIFFSFAYGKYAIGTILFLVTRITDILDGFLARKYKSETNAGAFIDQTADRVVMVSLTIGFFQGSSFPLFALLFFVGRDLLFILGNSTLFFSKNYVPKPTFLGMSTTFLQFASITSYYFLFFEKQILIVAMLFTAASIIAYAFQILGEKG